MNKKVKIAIFCTGLHSHDGWSRYSRSIITQYIKRGYQLEIFIPQSQKNTREMIHGDNSLFRIHPILCSQKWGKTRVFTFPQDFFKVKKLTKDCNIIFCLTEPFLLLCALVKTSEQKMFHTIHGTYCNYGLSGAYKNIYKKVLARVDKIVAISHYTKKRFLSSVNNQFKNKIVVIPNGVDPIESKEEDKPKENFLLMVGAIKERKGHREAIYAMERVVKNFPDAKLFIIGKFDKSNSYYLEIKKCISELRLNDHVFFKGRVSENMLIDFYLRTKLLLAPSLNVGRDFEGFGLTHLEANQYGTITLGSKECGNEDAIKDEFSGFIVKQRDPQALADRIEQVLDSEFDHNTFSQQAKTWAKHHSWDIIFEKYLELLS